MKKIIVLMCFLFLVVGCKDNEDKKEMIKDNSNKISITKVSCNEMKDLVKEGAILIDVRELDEYDSEHLDNAINISYTVIGDKIKDVVDDLEKDIIVYCRSGARSSKAASTLINAGYKNIYDLGSIDNCMD